VFFENALDAKQVLLDAGTLLDSLFVKARVGVALLIRQRVAVVLEGLLLLTVTILL
jgi:hypothetical protein